MGPLFTGPGLFRPAASGADGEIQLFEQAGIKLVHGWLVDPSCPEYEVLSRTQDYDSSVNLLVEADYAIKGNLVVAEDAASQEGSPSRRDTACTLTGSADEQRKVEGVPLTLCRRTALLIRNFIKNSPSQLTALYTLATDQVFLHEPSVVWERLEDFDSGWSTRSSPAGGDYVGHTAESALAALEQQTGALTLADRADEELARELQAEEDERSRENYARRQREREEKDRAERERSQAARRRAVDNATRVYDD
ncbi:hypothetical protein PYCCODRAFT_1447383 [Trametes coccinea BRFM310]|uniref:MINDY deubiquitinase domain-containing protein n=1 Tax=Trametes coccinea (strain BRFM310) TaxID=1353009 RepID=A0A1Y2IBK7_TRAC3|nr:hypothetical protein PYCCODRAFT_1447383 [Trametes coccinea BRFM310]